ncbi:hypothetical protein SAMD00019534_044580, partial [Acytostelium subglobosum LB1]|uniref:hypothetical protein n=1 Tax=Acytostelium subglobosum LB1 TaxID=1410327 RepID=UPI000644C589
MSTIAMEEHFLQQQQQQQQHQQPILNSFGAMEGLIICKVCLGQTQRYNKACHLCSSELGERCWRCNHLCKPNSKFCFWCNVKLHLIDIPSVDSILPIPPYKSTLAASQSIKKHQQQQQQQQQQQIPHVQVNLIAEKVDQSGTPPIRSLIENINKNIASSPQVCSPPRPGNMTSPRQKQPTYSSATYVAPKKRSSYPNTPLTQSNPVCVLEKPSLSSSVAAQQKPPQSLHESSSTRIEEFDSANTSQESIEFPPATAPLVSTPLIQTPQKQTQPQPQQILIQPAPQPQQYYTIALAPTIQPIIPPQPITPANDSANSSFNSQTLSYDEIDIRFTDSLRMLREATYTIGKPAEDPSILEGYKSPTSSSNSTSSMSSVINSPTSELTSTNELAGLSPIRGNLTPVLLNVASPLHVIMSPSLLEVSSPNLQSVCDQSGNGPNDRTMNDFIDAFPSPPINRMLSPSGSISLRSGVPASLTFSSPAIIKSPSTPLSPVLKPTQLAQSVASTSSSASTVRSLTSSIDKRAMLIEEMTTTELDYIKDLETIIQVFYRPLRDDLKLLSTEEFVTIFSNIEQLLQVNQELYTRLISSSSSIGEVFCIMSSSFDVYSVYCNYHQKSLESINSLSKMPQMENFVSELSHELRTMSLHSFLIKPVQRICKYPIFLRELLKATPVEHDDHGQLILALAKIEQIVQMINKEKMENDVWQRTMQILQTLKGSETLQLSKRHLLNEGALQLVEGYNENSEKKATPKFKKGYYFLFHDIFLFAKQKGNSYRLLFSIPLDTVLVHNNVYNDKHFFTLIEIGVGGKRWTFHPQPKALNLILYNSLQKLIEKCWENRFDEPPKSLNSPSSQSPTKKRRSNRFVKSLVNMKTL